MSFLSLKVANTNILAERVNMANENKTKNISSTRKVLCAEHTNCNLQKKNKSSFYICVPQCSLNFPVVTEDAKQVPLQNFFVFFRKKSDTFFLLYFSEFSPFFQENFSTPDCSGCNPIYCKSNLWTSELWLSKLQ